MRRRGPHPAEATATGGLLFRKYRQTRGSTVATRVGGSVVCRIGLRIDHDLPQRLAWSHARKEIIGNQSIR
jgi:hypothetical protein